jgi:hypothetical protein
MELRTERDVLKNELKVASAAVRSDMVAVESQQQLQSVQNHNHLLKTEIERLTSATRALIEPVSEALKVVFFFCFCLCTFFIVFLS